MSRASLDAALLPARRAERSALQSEQTEPIEPAGSTGQTGQTGPSEHDNVASWLAHYAGRQPESAALICAAPVSPGGERIRTSQVSFRELEWMTSRAARELQAAEIGAGDRVILMVPPSPAFFAMAFAILRIGAVMVAVDPGMGPRRVRQALLDAKPAGFVGSAKAHLARHLFRWGGAHLRLSVFVGPSWAKRAFRWLDALRGVRATYEIHVDERLQALVGPDRGPRRGGSDAESSPHGPSPPAGADADWGAKQAAILFTSGSTGPPKGVRYTHRNFQAQLRALRTAYGIEAGERELATFPLFALFGPALGMSAVIPRMDFTRPGRADPRHLKAVIQAQRVTSMFGSPALLRRLCEDPVERDPTLATLRRVVSAGAPVPARTIARLREQLAPDARIHTPYGATEALPISTIADPAILGETAAATGRGAGVCVGRPTGGIDLQIIAISDAPIPRWDPALALPDGSIGEIVVRGPVVTDGYFEHPDADLAAKIEGEQVRYHRMGDLGYRDALGRIWFCGRKRERLRVRGRDVYTVPVEGIFDQHPTVHRTALVAVHASTGTHLVLCVELEPPAPLTPPPRWRSVEDDLRRLAARYPQTRPVTHFLPHPGFPVDPRHNAKIEREVLARWAAEKLAAPR